MPEDAKARTQRERMYKGYTPSVAGRRGLEGARDLELQYGVDETRTFEP